MHDEAAEDRLILNLLLCEPGPGPWAIDELARKVGGRSVDDSIERLHRAGLIHRLEGGFVFASRAAASAAAVLDPESHRR
jgi:hypothetical protein